MSDGTVLAYVKFDGIWEVIGFMPSCHLIAKSVSRLSFRRVPMTSAEQRSIERRRRSPPRAAGAGASCLTLGMALVKAGLSRTVPAFTFILEETRRRAGLVALRRQLKAELKQQLNKPWISGPRQVSE
jgi:hypothetical protein